MVSTARRGRLDDLAQDLFDVLARVGAAAPRGRRRAGDLKDIEYHTLALLHERGTMIVGDIQRQLGVLPAQMSRIIRALEDRPLPLIACRINPHDKRKIDVDLTEAGEKALEEYQSDRVRRLAELLHDLTEGEQESLVLLLDRLRTLLDQAPLQSMRDEG
jgi:DNA-binding MarR family transcriptional regulator